MALNRKVFFDAVRSAPFDGTLTQSQVSGIETLLDYWESLAISRDLRWLAYILATVCHETGGRMVPVREGFADSDAEAQAMVTRMYREGRIKRNYAAPVNGISYFGRGRVQNTWHGNYVKLQERFGLPFVTQPGILLDDRIDAMVTIVGHIEGIWTGRKLADYFGPARELPVEARRIVNGLDRAEEVAGYYRAFKSALEAAWETPGEPVEPDSPPPAPEPLPERAGPLWDAYVALAAHFGDAPPVRPQAAAQPEETTMIPAILAPVITQLVTHAVNEALRRVAQDPTKPLTPGEPVRQADIPVVATEVARQVNAAVVGNPQLREADQRLANATNSEPWYQSRVYVGLLTGIVGTVGAVAGFALAPEDVDMIVGALAGITAIGGQLYAWYGRRKGAQLKPLGA